MFGFSLRLMWRMGNTCEIRVVYVVYVFDEGDSRSRTKPNKPAQMKKLMFAILIVVLVMVARTGLPETVTFDNLTIREDAGALDQAAARLLLVVIKPTIHDYVVFKTAEWKDLKLVCLPFGKWGKL